MLRGMMGTGEKGMERNIGGREREEERGKARAG